MRNAIQPQSLWRETAVAAPAARLLSGTFRADIAIIGGGYTGLSAALRATERGLKPAVLEAAEVGFGASGRNGGVVSPKYRVSLADMARAHGLDLAHLMNRLAHDAMDSVERYVAECRIDRAGFAKVGNLRCAHNKVALDRLVSEAETARRMFGDESLRILDAQEMRAETGSRDFVGGVLNAHAGVVHPLNYVRGLAAAVRERGGEIFEQSEVTTIHQRPDSLELRTEHGAVVAGKLLMATNGYSDLTSATSAVRKAVIPFRSAMVATEPLTPEMFSVLIPSGRSYSETRRMMRWFRRIDDRLLFGGRGAFGRSDSAAAFAALEGEMKRIFPQIADRRVTHRWSGLVAMTLDSLPQIGLLDSRTAFSVGYNGAGIAMASLLGRHAIDLLLGEETDLGLMRRAKPQAIPFYGLRKPVVRIVAGWYALLDRIGR
jgi:gamma-glutamylputrescine oxidase